MGVGCLLLVALLSLFVVLVRVVCRCFSFVVCCLVFWCLLLVVVCNASFVVCRCLLFLARG